jgi:hypothetical protein
MKITKKWLRQSRRISLFCVVLLAGYLFIQYGWDMVRDVVEDIYDYQAEELTDDDYTDSENTKSGVLDKLDGSKSRAKYGDDSSEKASGAEGPPKAGDTKYNKNNGSVAEGDGSETGKSPSSPSESKAQSTMSVGDGQPTVKPTVKDGTIDVALSPCTDDACRIFRDILFRGLGSGGSFHWNASSPSSFNKTVESKASLSSSADDCDNDCASFRETLSTWPPDKPKAVIYMLVKRRTLVTYRQAIRSIDRQFNRQFRYPIVVFAPPDLDTEADRRLIKEHNRSAPIYVQIVRFDDESSSQPVAASSAAAADGLPSVKRQPLRRRQRESPVAVEAKHSTWFHSGAVYDQPIFRSPGLAYVMRLTDDWLMAAPIKVDLFKYMKQRRLLYGFWKTKLMLPQSDLSLCTAVEEYINSSAAESPLVLRAAYNRWRQHPTRHLCRWELSELALWRSAQYRDFFAYVDRLGGIYTEGWSEQTIKSIALALFVGNKQMHQFKELQYVRSLTTVG